MISTLAIGLNWLHAWGSRETMKNKRLSGVLLVALAVTLAGLGMAQSTSPPRTGTKKPSPIRMASKGTHDENLVDLNTAAILLPRANCLRSQECDVYSHKIIDNRPYKVKTDLVKKKRSFLRPRTKRLPLRSWHDGSNIVRLQVQALEIRRNEALLWQSTKSLKCCRIGQELGRCCE
jgi:hypothetical protein